MMNEQLKSILYEYANTRGTGMPLTAEEMLNAISSWLVTVLPECIDITANTLPAGSEATAELTGKGTPDDHYKLVLGIPQGEAGAKGENGNGFSADTQVEYITQNVTYSAGKAQISGNTEVNDTDGGEFVLDLNIAGKNGINVDANASGDGLDISLDGSAGGATGITLSGAAGTLTPEQLQTLETSVLNYIVCNNEIYTLADNEASSGYYTYSHCGIQNNNQTYIKCITITISTRAYTLTTKEVSTKKLYRHWISLTSTINTTNCAVIFYNDSALPITTIGEIDDILKVNTYKYYPATGVFVYQNVTLFIMGIFSSNNPSILNFTGQGISPSEPTYQFSVQNVTISDFVEEV